jgi:PTH1 family peptidyl-tRNA hydrolase
MPFLKKLKATLKGGFFSKPFLKEDLMAEHTFLFVGLGNPGAKYENNRHNIGFKVIDSIASFFKVSSFQSKFQGDFAVIKEKEKTIFLFKPQTYMNLSGNAVASLLKFYKIPLNHVFVIHDDLDLLPGKIKIKQGGGSGGHNGLGSIDKNCGPNYFRIRLGIGHSGDKNLVSDYVLSNFSSSDDNWLEPFLWYLGRDLIHIVDFDHVKWLNTFHQNLLKDKK